MAKTIKDGFVHVLTGILDLSLKLDDPDKGGCRKAYDAMCRMDPAEWELSYTLPKGKIMEVVVRLTSVHGSITLRDVPISELINDVHFGFTTAQLTMNYIDYNRLV